MSEATATTAFFACKAAIKALSSRTSPVVEGYCNKAPNTSWLTASVALPMITSKPNISARVRTTSIVCGCTSSAIKYVLALLFATRLASAIASAAAVASSSNEADASSMPVKSKEICWKFSRASKRP